MSHGYLPWTIYTMWDEYRSTYEIWCHWKLYPYVYAEFLKGNFVVKKSMRAWSAIAIDKAHKQNNASVKGDGGAVGLTENLFALRHWMVSGTEMARIIQEFVWVNREGPRHRWTSSWTKETYIGGICKRFAIPEPSNWRDGEPIFWMEQWSPCLEQQRCCGHISGRHSAQMEKLGLQQYEREACEPDCAH